MKKTLCVILAALLIACTIVPAFAAGGSYTVTFYGPSSEFEEDAYRYYKSTNGEFKDFVEDPDGGYGFYSVDEQYYYIDNLTTNSRAVFDNAAPGSPESVRYSPAQWGNGTVEAGQTVSFIVLTSDKYDITTVTVLCNGKPLSKNAYGEYAVTADKNLTFRVLERDPETNDRILLPNHYSISLTSGEGYAAKPKIGENNRAVYYGEDFEFRVKITSGFNGDNMQVKVVRGDNFLSEFLGEDADMLTSVIGGSETLASTGVDVEGCRTYKIKNITSDCKVMISGVNKDSSSGILAMFKRILRLLLGLFGINLDGILGEDNNPLAAYTITLNTDVPATGVTYTTNPEFKYNSATGKYEAEVLGGECVTLVVTKSEETQNVTVDWTGKDPDAYRPEDIQWQAYYNFNTQKTTWSAVWYIDGIGQDTTITIMGG